MVVVLAVFGFPMLWLGINMAIAIGVHAIGFGPELSVALTLIALGALNVTAAWLALRYLED